MRGPFGGATASQLGLWTSTTLMVLIPVMQRAAPPTPTIHPRPSPQLPPHPPTKMRQVATRTLYTSVTLCVRVDAWRRCRAHCRPSGRMDAARGNPGGDPMEAVGMDDTNGG